MARMIVAMDNFWISNDFGIELYTKFVLMLLQSVAYYYNII